MLEVLLEPYPEALIVLSDWTPVVKCIDHVKEHLGSLAGRVVGTLYQDVISKVPRTVSFAYGGGRELGYWTDDFRRMSRAQAVSAHVAWSKPTAWIVITSDYFGWTPEQRSRHVVITEMVDALGTADAQHELAVALAMNFRNESRRRPWPATHAEAVALKRGTRAGGALGRAAAAVRVRKHPNPCRSERHARLENRVD